MAQRKTIRLPRLYSEVLFIELASAKASEQVRYSFRRRNGRPCWKQRKEADLWLIDLATRTSRELTEVNSPDTESYHSWSSNSRWFVFSSRRIDGLYTRPYIASIDEEGRIKKPFLLPQKGSDYYDRSLYSFNIPEFVTSTVKLNVREVEKKALSTERKQVTYRQ